MSATLVVPALNEKKHKDVPDLGIELEWLESVPPLGSRVHGFFLDISADDVLTFPDSIKVEGRKPDEAGSGYETGAVYLAERDVIYADLNSVAKHPRVIQVVLSTQQLALLKDSKTQTKFGFILNDGSRT